VLGVLAIVKIKDEDDFFNYVKDLIEDLFNNTDAASIKAFRALQVQFKCCGVNNYTDYTLPDINGYHKSCCEYEVSPCFHPFPDGCAFAFTNEMKNNIVIIGYVAVGFAVV
ncbi:Tetraspannin domain containing protein, partial [Asbolus verrucosus]